MLKQYLHDTLEGTPSFMWWKRSAVKIFDRPRLVICLPVGSKLSQDVTFDEKGEPKALIDAIRIPATIPVQWLVSQMQLIHPLNTSCVYLSQYGKLAGEARQILTSQALGTVQEDGYILYWDDDTLPDQTALYTMFNWMEQHPECGVLSAVYCTREAPNEPIIYKTPTAGVDWGFSMGPDVEPEEIFSAGAGFMLCRASAVAKATAANPGIPIWADMKTSKEHANDLPDEWGMNMTWGHDIRFCRLIANEGYKIMVDGRVECGHLDIATQVIHKLADNSLPKRRGQASRGQLYWDSLYSAAGVENIKYSGDLYLELLKHVHQGDRVIEIGCGVGVLGTLLTAQGACHWTGYDQSEVAVNMACGRFLNAYKKQVHELTAKDFEGYTLIVASQLMDYLTEEDASHLMRLAKESGIKFVYTDAENTVCIVNGENNGSGSDTPVLGVGLDTGRGCSDDLQDVGKQE